MNQYTYTWTFPKDIKFDMVPHYLKKFDKIPENPDIIFDLSVTKNIHSSFIGFLIHAKRKTEKQGSKLILQISPSLEKIFFMLNIENYLNYEIVREVV